MENQYNGEIIKHTTTYKGFNSFFEWDEEKRKWCGYLEADNSILFESESYEGYIIQFSDKVDML